MIALGNTGTPAALFAGGGQLGALMAAIDWAATPLGPVETWPQSLKTCVRIVLTSRQPMFVWWGDALINLYNDAYRSILGGKHPSALGRPAAEVWREIWSDIEPRAAAAMAGNVGTYDEALLLIMERHGYAEETYYTFSYSPVPNDQGGTGGILCANTEDTQPDQIGFDDPYWRISEPLDTASAVSRSIAPELGTVPQGAWPRPPLEFALLPINPAGASGQAGLLVGGLSPFRLFDEQCRGFLELVAGQLALSARGTGLRCPVPRRVAGRQHPLAA